MEKKNNDSSDRRRFIRKLARLGAAGGIAALLSGTGKIAPVQGYTAMGIDINNYGTGITELDSSLSSGAAFRGYATATSGATAGVIGRSDSANGTGVSGTAAATSGPAMGVFGGSASTSGTAVFGWATATSGEGLGVFGQSESPDGISVMGRAGNAGTKPIVARGVAGQTASLQEWQNDAGAALSAVNKDGWMGVGTASPARSIHLVGSQACFRMDRNVNSSAFILVRTSPDFSSVWKTFYVGVDASGVNDGEFFIGDVGTNVSGPSAKRLWIDNSGGVHVPNLISGDIALANDFTVTEDEKHGIAFKNDVGEKIAVLDREGNFHIKGKVMEDL